MFLSMSRVLSWTFALWMAAALAGCTLAGTAQPTPTPTLAATSQPAPPPTLARTSQPAPTPTLTPTSQPVATPTPAGQIANPASEHCVKQGGTLVIQQRGDGDQYGMCVFEDNRQCEEWAMFRDECPVGGIEIVGYITPAAQYCAITGGTYQVTGKGNTDQEQGTCTFQNGRTCDAGDYYAGICTPNAEAGPSSYDASFYDDPFAYCAAVETLDTPDARYNGPPMPDSILQAMVRQGIVTADAPPEFLKNAVWRCMNNSVWVCHFGANLPCTEQADTSQTPAPAMEDYCKTNPTAEFIPAFVAGRATVYEWGCTDGKAVVIQQLFTGDPQGYLAEFWYELTPK